jgi:dihydrofolate reductase
MTFAGVIGQIRHDHSHRRYREYLALGAVDELGLHVVPITLGAGERIFDGIRGLTFDIGRIRPTAQVVHVELCLPGR